MTSTTPLSEQSDDAARAFIERVGHLFHVLRLDTQRIAVALSRDEASVYRALHQWRGLQRSNA